MPDEVKVKTKQDGDNCRDSLKKGADTSKETICFKGG